MEYTREQAAQVLKDYQRFKMNSIGVEFFPELNYFKQDFLKHKFSKLEVVEEETYSIGDRFEIDGDEYILSILSKITYNTAVLINLKTGKFWRKEIEIQDDEQVSRQELKKIIGEFFINRVTKIK
jgi:hypothetical protein